MSSVSLRRDSLCHGLQYSPDKSLCLACGDEYRPILHISCHCKHLITLLNLMISIKRISIHMFVSHPYHNHAHSKEQWCHCLVDSLSPKHKDIYGVTLSQVKPTSQGGIHYLYIADRIIIDILNWSKFAYVKMFFINISKYQNYRYNNMATKISVKIVSGSGLIFHGQYWAITCHHYTGN